MRVLLAIISALIIFLSNSAYAIEEKAVYSLFIAGDSSATSFVDLTHYINKKLNLSLKTEIQPSYVKSANMIMKKEALLGFLCSGPYVILRDKYNFEPLAAIKPLNRVDYRGYLIVPSNSKATSIKDLKGKRFAIVDLISYTGRIVALYDIIKLNEDPLNYFSEIIYSKTHESSIKLVLEGQADGAYVMSIVFENVARQNPALLSKVKVIGKSPKAGFPLFVVNKYTDTKLKESIKNVLLSMHKDAEGRKILNSLGIELLTEVNLNNYKIIEEQVRVTKDYIPY